MVRIMIKGGVWKNTEDEILKAAVMKYGKNQWSRVSSLLVRKSAKQCKARWHEWLDPSIKKTEWTRVEDEKLLHLAKLMPTQWRTIAPIVGRTSAQCLERYEALLDRAANGADGGSGGDGMAAGPSGSRSKAGDPRRMRAGEIDTNPEARPARPDPVDMDEDEKEMLNEARARLANTKGKKAKRKAREKQLEEARRLASLQKKREMKAAGMLSKYKKKRKGIDYNAEIAFEHKPPPGFYDTSEEQQKEKTGALHKDFKPVRLDELEGKRRKDIEAGLIKKDKARKAILERKNMPLALAQQMQNQAGPAVKRGKLMLPAPQLSDGELRQIARMNEQEDIDGSDLAQQGAGGRATKMLLADYSATPNPMATPMRTPRATTSTGTDLLLQEANQLAKMQQLQSTLMGGEGTSIDSATFKGAMPESKTMSTPNPLATPLHAQQAGLSMLHQSHNRMIQSSGATPMVMSTPIRDGLHINRPGSSQAMTEFDAVDLETKRERDLQVQNVKFALASLPKPKNEYQVVLPDLAALDDDDEDMKDAKVEEDMEDVIAREKAQVKEERQRKLRMRSQVVQRNLPRTTMDLMVQATTSALEKAAEESENEQAASLITEELKRIVKYDRGFHPVKRQFECSFAKEPRRAGLLDYENMSEDQILQARSMIMEENQSLMKGNAHLREEHAKAFDAYLEGEAEGQNTSFPRFMAGLQHNFQNIVSEIERKGKQAKKLEKKVKIINGGHEKKEGDVLKRFESVHQRHALAKEKLGAFSMLKDLESEAAPQRIHALQNELEKEKSKEKELQKRYAQLTRGTPVP